ncbi:MAG: RNA chaperone Hfq [Candidatus Fermentithermobacillus carboniphilus]|uniref:RNA-binding protein Hfq n=1 Tax=Candidatus Fermentithermobacillus carboniphilus TaxID=3085328 RepID=A0AAT9LC19_9FIRM|nr:MAG: RNA chaperone Hfq [Candidatus Fermentithermobacillus carboniphilus]
MTAKNTINLQDSFLNQIRKENTLTTVYLINGFQLKGIVKGFDSFTVILDSDGKQMLIYKHAISTITPSKPVSFQEARETAEERAQEVEKAPEI